MKEFLSLFGVLLVLASCQITQTGKNVDDDLTIVPVETELPTATPTSTTIPTTTTATVILTDTGADCVPQNPQWPVYIVHAGDTLTQIAQATGTLVAELVHVNCLNNANTIHVGQMLRVPRLPQVVPTAPAALPVINDTTLPASICAVVPSGIPVEIFGPGDGPGPVALLGGTARLLDVEPGALVIELKGFGYNGRVRADITVRTVGENCPGQAPPPSSDPHCLPVLDGDSVPGLMPSLAVHGQCLSLLPGQITVSWPNAPEEFEMVEFWTRDGNDNTNVIGVDQDDSDNATIIWNVHPEQQPVRVYAIAYGRHGTAQSGEIAVYLRD